MSHSVKATQSHRKHLDDRTLITFKVMDLFRFKPGTDEVEHPDLIYDTHPIRATAGNKYEL